MRSNYNNEDDDEKSRYKAFVGIDFGTDGSGLAYALPDMSAYIHNMWGDAQASKKTKTSVLLSNENKVIRAGTGAQDMYLKCTSDQGWKLFEQFKMSLYEEPATKAELKDANQKREFVELKEQIRTTNDAAVTESSSVVFVAELKYLREQAFNFIETHLRKKLKLRGSAEQCWPEIQYFLTVPAIWSDKAKDKMVGWAKQAGLITGEDPEQLKIVYEPDCASISIQHAILRSMNSNRNNSNSISNTEPKKKRKKKKMEALQPQININAELQAGDKYILLDVGGGTCDVACHEVIGKFAIAEVLHPSGGKWGATYIDKAFIKLLGRIFSPALLNIFQMSEQRGRQSYLKLLNYFINESKLSYYEHDTDEVPLYHDIPLPDNFVTFVVTQFVTDFHEGTNTLDVAPGLRDLNQHLEMKSKEYRTYDMSVASSATDAVVPSGVVAAGPGGDSDSEEGANSNNNNEDETNKNKKLEAMKNRDWMIKIIEADEDDDDVDEEYLLSMHDDVWRHLFGTIINPIIGHCKKILKMAAMKHTKYVFLVGGFANCKYFQKRIREAVSSYKSLSVVTPELPGLCVVDGAARYGLNTNFVKVRRLAKTYGIETSNAKSTLDLRRFPKGYIKKHKHYDETEECDYVDGIFSAFVHKDDAIRLDDKPFTRTFRKYRNADTCQIVIYSSTKSKPLIVKREKKLGEVTVPMASNVDQVVVEFAFSHTMFTVYAFPENRPDQKKICKINYQ